MEIRQGRLIVRGMGRRKTLSLSQLASAEVVVIGRRCRSFLRLRDQQGMTAMLSLDSYPAAKRRLALAALTPYIMAPEVQRTGQVGASRRPVAAVVPG